MTQARDKYGRFLPSSGKTNKTVRDIRKLHNVGFLKNKVYNPNDFKPEEDKLNTLVVYLVDRSGSMANVRTQVTGGFQEY